jgi:solute carrier family 25 (mitochondrial aspartate/glutamate transporter), member 12/13
MSAPATVKEAVKESLLGSEEPSNLSAKNKATFVGLASKDPETGELFMHEDQFIDAVAPADEDYVCARADRCLL